jgi:hypothetical protein
LNQLAAGRVVSEVRFLTIPRRNGEMRPLVMEERRKDHNSERHQLPAELRPTARNPSTSSPPVTSITPTSSAPETALDKSISPCKDSTCMRMLLNISFPHDPFNAAVKDGTAGQKLGRIIDETKPEAIYFTEQQGGRGAVMIVNMSDPSNIPALAEPWFLTFNATVEFRVVMTPDDLQKASLEEVGKKWG